MLQAAAKMTGFNSVSCSMCHDLAGFVLHLSGIDIDPIVSAA